MKTILLADDEANLRTLVHATLDDPQFVILEASAGSQVLELAKQKCPDLVILDWMMPGMSGLEVLKLLRSEPETASIPVLMLTARGQENDRLLAIAAGADGYIVKPFSPLDLLHRVTAILDSPLFLSPLALEDPPLDPAWAADKTGFQVALYARDLKRMVAAERARAGQLAEANERLKQLSSLKSDFLSFISHELQTPLTAISMVDLLDPRGDPQDQVELTGIIQSGYQRLRAFISRGLDYLNWLAMEKVECKSVSDLSCIVKEVAASMPALQVADVDFRIDSPRAACSVRVEKAHLTEIVKILLDNAIKFSPPEKVVRVAIRSTILGIGLSVSDNGSGLSPEGLRELFQPYTIFDAAHHSAGTGLNLAIAHTIAQLNGGSLRGESSGLGQGSTFHLQLPAAQANDA